MIDDPSDLHVMPSDGTDLILHDCSINCFCDPFVKYKDDETRRRVFVHKLISESIQ